MSKESIKLRMKELGLVSDKQWDIYKYLYNNVSIDEEDRSENFGEKMYAKMAKCFLKFQKKSNIWKDPKVELPKEHVVFVYSTEKTIGEGVIRDGKFFTHGILFNKLEFNWCYEEDLAKQAQGENK